VARDRKRAKQRRDRRVRQGAPASPPSKPARADLPGSLDHASAEVDEFDAALVRGADGVPAPPDSALEAEVADEAEAADEAEVADGAEVADELQETLPASGGARGGGRGDGRGDGHAAAVEPSGAPLREGNRVVGFLRASWAELQRVQWPDRRQVAQATAVVLGFVAIAGLYLGLADFIAKEIVEAILS